MIYYCTNGFYMLQGFQWYIIFNFLDSWIKRYEFLKFGLKSDSNFYLNSILIRELTHGEFLFADTVSVGLGLCAIGFKWI
jgi:hypothetical protein